MVESILLNNNFIYQHTLNETEKWYVKGSYSVMYNESDKHLIVYCINDIILEYQDDQLKEITNINEQFSKL